MIGYFNSSQIIDSLKFDTTITNITYNFIYYQKGNNINAELYQFDSFHTDDKPSTSKTQKRPSPHANDYPQSVKRKSEDPTTPNTSIQSQSTSTTETKHQNTSNSSGHTNSSATPTNSPTDTNSANNSTATSGPANAVRSTGTIQPNEALLDEIFMLELKLEWNATPRPSTARYKQKFQFLDDSVKLNVEPFTLCTIRNFLSDANCVRAMEREMCSMEWHRKQMDLYEFHQTTDLANLSLYTQPIIKQFYNMLNKQMLPWMRKITGLPLTRISASCSMYNRGDYLLVHDDLLSDRQIAFVYYLSPWLEEWRPDLGGALELFECDPITQQPKYPIVEKIPPRNNQFVFFRVCRKSFHQVGEVTGAVYPRLTINGWFHGDVMGECSSILRSDAAFLGRAAPYVDPSYDEVDLTEWINGAYLTKSTKTCIQRHIEERSEASLEAFLIREFYDLLVTEFIGNDELRWELEGPANQRKFETLRLDGNITSPPKDLVNLFRSPTMFTLLHEYTELDFDGDNVKAPTCSIQICRFTQGCYTLLGDSSSFTENALDVILFFNATNEVGKITYLSPNECADDSDAETEHTGSLLDFAIADATGSDSPFVSIQLPQRKKRVGRRPGRTLFDPEAANNEKSKPPSADESKKSTKRNNDHNNQSDDSNASENDSDSEYLSCEAEEEEQSSGADELTQEDALLTIHPKNNSLNLVYRTRGQAKFVKYISKSSLQPDEYVYVLFATYKE